MLSSGMVQLAVVFILNLPMKTPRFENRLLNLEFAQMRRRFRFGSTDSGIEFVTVPTCRIQGRNANYEASSIHCRHEYRDKYRLLDSSSYVLCKYSQEFCY